MNSKDRFLKMPEAKLFADMVGSEACKKALDYAMLEMQEGASISMALDPTDPEHNAAFAFQQLRGALRFRRILETLSLPEEAVKPDRSPTLDYDAYNRPIRTRSSTS